MKWMRMLFVMLLLLGLAAPAMAQVQLNNSEIPGSVLVFPKFIRGTVQIGVTTGANPVPIVEPRSSFEVSVTCPSNGPACAEGAKVKLLARWVCPGSQNLSQKFVCRETDFELFTTVKGTLWFNPDNIGPSNTTTAGVPQTRNVTVPTPSCQRGWLIVWVISPNDGSAPFPIKFDGLVGDAVLRNANGSAGAYTAYPIQAVNGIAANAAIGNGTELLFDGTTQYKAVTGQLRGSVRLERTVNPTGNNLGRIQTFLTMLTLDTLSNRPNFPTFVDLHFFNEAEVILSTSHEFICWTQVRLTTIDPNLDQFFGTKALLETTEAEKVAIFGVDDVAGPVTLLGIIETLELNRGGTVIREYSYGLFNDGNPVPTRFEPN
jgi:hypothetical protein